MKITVYPNNSYSVEMDNGENFFKSSIDFPKLVEEYGIEEKRDGFKYNYETGKHITIKDVDFVLFPTEDFTPRPGRPWSETRKIAKKKLLEHNPFTSYKRKSHGKISDN